MIVAELLEREHTRLVAELLGAAGFEPDVREQEGQQHDRAVEPATRQEGADSLARRQVDRDRGQGPVELPDGEGTQVVTDHRVVGVTVARGVQQHVPLVHRRVGDGSEGLDAEDPEVEVGERLDSDGAHVGGQGVDP